MKRQLELWKILAGLIPLVVAGGVTWGVTWQKVQANEDTVKEQSKAIQTIQKQTARVDERTKLILEMLKEMRKGK